LFKKFKKLIPWWLKIALKIILSRLPLNYQNWSKFGLFKHGEPEDKFLYFEKFAKHFDLSFPEKKPKNFVCLELGPGDTVLTGIIAHTYGAQKTYLVDIGDFAIKDLAYYKDFIQQLSLKKIHVLNIDNIKSFDQLLSKFNIEYLHNGHSSLNTIKSNSIDFLFSHSAIEHIRLFDIENVILETNRVIKPKGVSSHNIDLMDHLDYSLNSLRFSKNIWESSFFSNSGFYTNRLRFSQIISIFETLGFKIIFKDFGSWDSIPIKREKLDKSFYNLSNDDLIIRTMHIILKK
jgi:hypothetical protein